MKMTELSIIIVNWNGVDFLPNCLKSIVENPPSVPYEIIVIDNASTDNSVAWLCSPECRELLDGAAFNIIKSDKNLGFGRANNAVFRETSSPFLFLLNPDTQVHPGTVNRLLETLRSDNEYGAVAPKQLRSDGKVHYTVWAFPPTPLSLFVEGTGLHRILPKRLASNWLYSSHWDYASRKAVPMFSGGAMIVKREMIDDIGAFDEDFFMYGEDGEWCVRMNRNGWKTVFEPDAIILHLGGASSAQKWGIDGARLKEEEAFILFQHKCLPKFLVMANLLTRIMICTVLYSKNQLLRRANNNLGPLIKLYGAAFWQSLCQ